MALAPGVGNSFARGIETATRLFQIGQANQQRQFTNALAVRQFQADQAQRATVNELNKKKFDANQVQVKLQNQRDAQLRADQLAQQQASSDAVAVANLRDGDKLNRPEFTRARLALAASLGIKGDGRIGLKNAGGVGGVNQVAFFIPDDTNQPVKEVSRNDIVTALGTKGRVPASILQPLLRRGNQKATLAEQLARLQTSPTAPPAGTPGANPPGAPAGTPGVQVAAPLINQPSAEKIAQDKATLIPALQAAGVKVDPKASVADLRIQAQTQLTPGVQLPDAVRRGLRNAQRLTTQPEPLSFAQMHRLAPPSKQPSKEEVTAAAAARSVPGVVNDISKNATSPADAKTKLGIVSKGLGQQASTLLKIDPSTGAIQIGAPTTKERARQAILAFNNGDIGTAEKALGLAQQAQGTGRVISMTPSKAGLVITRDNGAIDLIPTSGAGNKQAIAAFKFNTSRVNALAAARDSAMRGKDAKATTSADEYIQDHPGVSQVVASVMSSFNFTGLDQMGSGYIALFTGLHAKVLTDLKEAGLAPTFANITQAVNQVYTDKTLFIAAARMGISQRKAQTAVDTLKGTRRAAYEEVVKGAVLKAHKKGLTPKQLSSDPRYAQIISAITGGQ